MGGHFLYQGGRCGGCGSELGTVEGMNGGRYRQYCNDACKQRAYRQRRNGDKVAKRNERKKAGVTIGEVERSCDMKLYRRMCGCGRSIWLTWGNVQIGGLRCDLCGGLFGGGK